MDLGLGLNMNKKYRIAILSIIVFNFIFFGASCLKKQNLDEELLSATVGPEDIASALSEGFGPIDYNDMKPNEFSSIILTQTIQDGVSEPVEQQDIGLKNIVNTSSYLQLDFTATVTQYSGGQSSQSTRDWNKVFTKYSGFAFSQNHNTNQEQANTTANVTEPLFMFQVIQNLALGSCYDDGDYPETCHNLQVQLVKYKVPSAAAYQHNCPDIYNCYIDARQVEFDLIRKYEIESDGKPKRIHYTLLLSQEVPFTSKVLKYCTRSLYDIQGVPQKILADLCYKVNNYTFGQ